MTGMAPHAEALTHFEFEQADILLAAVHIALDDAARGCGRALGQLTRQVRHFEAADVLRIDPIEFGDRRCRKRRTKAGAYLGLMTAGGNLTPTSSYPQP